MPSSDVTESEDRRQRGAIPPLLDSPYGKLLLLETAIAVLAIAGLWLLPVESALTLEVAGRSLGAGSLWLLGACALMWLCVSALLAGLHANTRGGKMPFDPEDSRANDSRLDVRNTDQASPLYRDTTRRELELAKAQAIQSSRMKSSLIARASHELLTPLNSISGFAGILQREQVDAATHKEYIELIDDNAQQLQTLVNDLISFADRHSDAMSIEYKKTDVARLLSSVARSFRDTVEERQLSLQVDINAVAGIEIETAPVRLRQMLSNLIVNAIRNTQRGTISISADLDIADPESARLHVRVADTGSGISAGRLDALRDQLANRSQAIRMRSGGQDDSFSIPQEQAPGLGFGLGIPIVADIADRLGATVTVESEAGHGSVFTLVLPARNWQRREHAATADNSIGDHNAENNADNSFGISPGSARDSIPARARALVVDDNRSNRLLLQHLLSSEGYPCDTAASGAEALGLLENKTYDWLFIDIGMRPMDGPGLLASIRKLPQQGKAPCIAFTALAHSEDQRRFRELGFDALLGKPIDPVALKSLAERFGFTPADNSYTVMPAKRASDTGGLARSTPTRSPDEVFDAVFDIQGAVHHTSGNRKVARTMAGLLLQELQNALDTQQRGFADKEAIQHHYHQLNGSASLGGTPELKKLLAKLEDKLVTEDFASPPVVELQETIRQQQASLIDWLSITDLDQAFAAD